jgi:hypothetical protein
MDVLLLVWKQGEDSDAIHYQSLNKKTSMGYKVQAHASDRFNHGKLAKRRPVVRATYVSQFAGPSCTA